MDKISKIEKAITHAFSVIKFNSCEAPVFKEVRGRNWVYYGEKNNYPDKLLEFYEKSSKHGAIIDGKVDYICGEGWETDIPELKGFIDNPNPDESLYDLTEKLALDLELYNGYYIQVVKSKGTNDDHYYHLPFDKMRTNKDETEYYYTADWSVNKPETNEDFLVLKPYKKGTKEASTVFAYKKYTPKKGTLNVYPKPRYIGALPYIEADIEVAEYDLDNIKSSFLSNLILNFYNGIPTEDEQKDIEKKIDKKFTGARGKKFMLNFSDGKDRGMEVQPLSPNENVDLFDQFSKRLKEEIYTGHRVTYPPLFGVREEGNSMGDDGGKFRIAYEIFKKTYISGRQKIIEDTINYLKTGVRSSRVFRLIEKAKIQEEVAMANVTPHMTRDEIREAAGLKPLEQPTATPNQPTQPVQKQFNTENESKILAKFAAMGKPASDYEVLKVRRLAFSADKPTMEQALEVENNLYKQCFAVTAKGKVEDIEAGILKILDKTPDAGYDAIAKELKISVERVKSILTDLIDAGYLAKAGKKLSITPAGEEVLPPVTRETTEIAVKYRYALNPEYPGPAVLPTTRPFCKELIGFNKLYDRKEIEQIANEEDYNVFLYRGGWYTNPTTNERTPHCRHIWESVVVTNKR